MSFWRYITVTFADPILHGRHPLGENRKFHVNLGDLLIADGLDLIRRFNLPRVSPPSALADWSREITEVEYFELFGPPNLEVLLAKHDSLRWMVDWRTEPGHEGQYAQVEEVFHLIEEFERGNRAVHYQLTVSDLG